HEFLHQLSHLGLGVGPKPWGIRRFAGVPASKLRDEVPGAREGVGPESVRGDTAGVGATDLHRLRARNLIESVDRKLGVRFEETLDHLLVLLARKGARRINE